MRLHVRCALLLILAACWSDPAAVDPDPDVRLVQSEFWNGSALLVVSPQFTTLSYLPLVLAEDTVPLDTPFVRLVPPDTLLIATICGRTTYTSDSTTTYRYSGCNAGRHSITLVLGQDRVRLPYTLFGVADWEDIWSTPITLRGVRPRALGHGSTQFYVATADGLARLDVRFPELRVVLDRSVEPGCLRSIGPSVSDGAVVSVARSAAGCGVLRARRYLASAVIEVDSGPPSAGWMHAAHVGNGLWLLTSESEVALAARQADGSYAWDRWPVRGADHFALSPASDLAVVTGDYAEFRDVDVGWGRGLLFDLGRRAVLDTLLASAATFSPHGDTLFTIDVSEPVAQLVLTDVHSGRELARFSAGWLGSVGQLVYDPFGPWLYGIRVASCPGFVVFDRRTWEPVGVDGPAGHHCATESVLVATSYAPGAWMVFGNFHWTVPVTRDVPTWIGAISVPSR